MKETRRFVGRRQIRPVLLAAFLILAGVQAAGAVELTLDQKRELLRAAEAAYAHAEALPADRVAERKAGFSASAVKYRQLADAGIHNGALYRNLGHALQRSGALGEAVASYEAALRVNPGDRQARAALAAVRNGLDFDLGRNLALQPRWWRPGLERPVVIVGVAVWSLGWLLLAVTLHRHARKWLWGTAVCFLVAAIAAGLLLALPSVTPALAVIVAQETPLYAAPHIPAAGTAALSEGRTLAVRKQRRGWVEVNTGGPVGWVRGSHIVLVTGDGHLLGPSGRSISP